jgi:hypothetical protein
MNEFIQIPAEICMEDVVSEITDNFFVDDVVSFIKNIDRKMDDPDLVKQLAEYFNDRLEEF